MNSTTTVIDVWHSPIGWLGVRASEAGVQQLALGRRDAIDCLQALGGDELGSATPPRWLATWRDLLQEYCQGAAVDLTLIPVDLPRSTAFIASVRQRLREIPYGRTCSYGELAAAAGFPGAARAVGQVLARNPVPLILPCHRVLGAGGRLGGFTAPSGVALKQQLLSLEGLASFNAVAAPASAAG